MDPTKGSDVILKKNPQPTALENHIALLEKELHNHKPYSDEYAKISDQLVKLNKIKDAQRRDRVTYDTLALIGGNLAGILLIMSYERVHVVTTKAFSFTMKLR